jgi:hypothetical protein
MEQKPLIQKMKKANELCQIRESRFTSYYTCVQYRNIPVSEVPYAGALGTPLTLYGPGQWSCMKGWFESYDNTFNGETINSKVIQFSKFRDPIPEIKRLLGEDFIIFHPK